MSSQASVAPTLRIVRHAGAAPGWVVQFQDTDQCYWVSYWDGHRWTKVARQRSDGTTEDEVTLEGEGDDAMVVRALELLERRKEVRQAAHGAAPVSLAVGAAGIVAAAICLVAGTWEGLPLLFAAVALVGFGMTIHWAFSGRGRVEIDDHDDHLPERKSEITGELSENATVGAGLGVALASAVGVALAIAVALFAILQAT